MTPDPTKPERGERRRTELFDRATGAVRYAADALPPDHLVATVVGSPIAHGIVTIDSRAALQVPGVIAVLDHRDDPQVPWSPNVHGDILDTAVFAREARFVGDIVAGVVAVDRTALEAGVGALKIQCEPLAAVADHRTALAPGAPAAWRDEEPAGDRPNLIFQIETGASADEIDEALATASIVKDETYELSPAPHGFIERPCAGARWAGGSESCTVWSTTQHPYLSAQVLARILGLDPASVSFEPVPVGGGFGGKEEIWLEPAAALLSRAAGGKPVLVEVDRAFVTSRSRCRAGGSVRVRTGVDSTGSIVARHVVVDFDAGANAGHTPQITMAAVKSAARMYPTGSTRVEGKAVRTNTPPSTAWRGYGGMEVLFAVESDLDELARQLGDDPVELRIRHALAGRETDPMTGWIVETFELAECLRRAHRLAGPPPDRGIGRWRKGRGIAALDDGSGMSRPGRLDESTVRCSLHRDTVVIETGTCDIGQGIHHALGRIASEALGLDPDRVAVVQVASDSAPPDGGVYASRGVYITGNATNAAALLMRDAIIAAAASRLGVEADEVELCSDGTTTDASGRSIRLDELRVEAVDGHFEAPDNGIVAGAQAVDLTVDTWTGQVTVDRVVSVHDIGRVIDPIGARGQVCGAVVQGLGVALLDPSDRMTSPRGFLEHLLPTIDDVPDIVVDFVEVPHPIGALGAKGIGESGVIGVPAAVANAVRDAIGLRATRLPITPEDICHHLETQELSLR